ncbi:MAG: penicillin-binding protein 2, partial [Caulobacterales bacterium]|nr:penicillin-binding protein 2 [Caulobacterales bacterium]
WDSFARVNLNRPDLPGVLADVAQSRAYGLEAANDTPRRAADAFAHVVGYVSKPTEDIIADRLDEYRDDQDRQASVRVLRHPAYRVGRSGVELSLDDQLQGEWGELRVEVDAYGRSIREMGLDQDARPGEDVTLTLDAELQAFALSRLEGESGAVVALDVETGEIRCLVSAPGFDPNRFVRGIETPAYRALVNDPRKPLYNKPLAGLYPPGSTFKMITCLAALRHELIDPAEKVFCNGKMRLGDREFHCWKREGHGAVDMRDSIKKSCDVYFYEVARRFERQFARGAGGDAYERGVDAIAQEARAFGLGPAFAIAAPGGRDGVVPTAAWKRARFDERWAGGETLIAAIGQGYLTASPLQLAVMTARIANGGRPVTPYVLADGSDQEPWPQDVTLADPAHLDIVCDGMFAVAEEWGGTAWYRLGQKGLDLPGVQMAGKTGTSQVRRITREERLTGVLENDELPWRSRDHGLFVCYAPYDKPRFAVAAVVEHGGSGSSAAAPPARDVLRLLLEREAARPSAGRGGRA